MRRPSLLDGARLAVLGSLAVVLAGCPPPVVTEPEPDPPGVYPHHTAAQVVDEMYRVAAGDAITSYSSTGRIALSSPEEDVSGSLVLRQRAADTLWASVRGPLNLEVLRMLATPDSFFVHDRLQNRLYLGSIDAAGQFLPGPVGIDEIFRALTGTILPEQALPWFANAGMLDGRPIYWLTAPDGRTRIAVDAGHWRVRLFERLGAEGVVIDRRRFASFEPTEGRMLPTVVELANPSEDLSVTIEHRRLVLNPLLVFPFDPRGATVIPLDDSGDLN